MNIRNSHDRCPSYVYLLLCTCDPHLEAVSTLSLSGLKLKYAPEGETSANSPKRVKVKTATPLLKAGVADIPRFKNDTLA